MSTENYPIITRSGDCIHNDTERIGYCFAEIKESHRPVINALNDLAAQESTETFEKLKQCSFWRWKGREGADLDSCTSGRCLDIPFQHNLDNMHINS